MFSELPSLAGPYMGRLFLSMNAGPSGALRFSSSKNISIWGQKHHHPSLAADAAFACDTLMQIKCIHLIFFSTLLMCEPLQR